MSDNGTTASGMPNPGQAAGPKLYNTAGEPLRAGSRPTRGQADWIADFIQQQPFTAVLVALVAGYVWGKIS
jgi:hypothetical protein